MLTSRVKHIGNLCRLVSIPLIPGAPPLQAIIAHNPWEGFTLSMFDPNSAQPVHLAENPVAFDQKPLGREDLVAFLTIAGLAHLADQVRNDRLL